MKRANSIILTILGCVLSASSLAMTFSNLHAADSYSDHILPRFVNIDAAGNVHVDIVPSKSGRAFYSIHEPAGSENQVYSHLRNHTLYLRQTGIDNGRAEVIIHMNRLESLNAFNGATIDGKNVRSNGLSLYAESNCVVNLSGMIDLNRLYASGNSRVKLGWVSGDNAAIYGKNHSDITLAGDIETVRTVLKNHTRLNAEYLRTNNTWIQTRDYAQAKVLALDGLQSYPDNTSNVFYYKTPQVVNRINSQSGNTLQLGWHS